MRVALLIPPVSDLTAPLSAIAYLAGQLKRAGFPDVSLLDLGVDFVNWTLRPEVAADLSHEVVRRRTAIEAQDALDFSEQEKLWTLAGVPTIRLEDLGGVRPRMRDLGSCLDFRRYRSDVALLHRYLQVLSVLSFPGELRISGLSGAKRFSNRSYDDLLNAALVADTCFPFNCYLESCLRHDSRVLGADLCGVSIAFDGQLVFAIHLSRWLKRINPGATVVLGGTAISRLVRFTSQQALLGRLFEVCDGIVLGEGESSVCELAATGGQVAPGSSITNLATCDRRSGRVHLPEQIVYKDLNDLATPAYDFSWSSYFAPHPAVSYTPTRGCYWQRCAFCDYGLNTDSATAPWRQRPVERVVDDLRQIVGGLGIRNVLFSVDVVSPRYLDALAEALLSAGLDISWSVDLRLEGAFSQQLCSKMARSGLVSTNVGFESGCQRVLDLMDKGLRVAEMETTIEGLSRAGVAVELMGFTGFPSETASERRATFEFLERTSAHWATAAVVPFRLTAGSAVARDPARFGITVLPVSGRDVSHAVKYRVTGDADLEHDDGEACEASLPVGRLPRPWGGSVASLHSQLYYAAFGPRVFHRLLAPDAVREPRVELAGAVVESAHDLATVALNRIAYKRWRKTRKGIERTFAEYRSWCEVCPPLTREGTTASWILGNAPWMQLDPAAATVLRDAGGLTVASLVARLEEAIGDGARELVEKLLARGLLVLVDAAPSQSTAIEEAPLEDETPPAS